MKMWVVKMLVWVLGKMGVDPAASAKGAAEERVKALVGELVRMRDELEGVKASKGYAEQMLRDRSVQVDLAGMLPLAQREGMVKALWEVPEVKGLLACLDSAWMAEINSMTHPQMDDRQRQWVAGRAEGYMMVKSWLVRQVETESKSKKSG